MQDTDDNESTEQNDTRVIGVHYPQKPEDDEAVIVVSHDGGRQAEIPAVKDEHGFWSIELDGWVRGDILNAVRRQVKRMNNPRAAEVIGDIYGLEAGDDR